MGHSMKPLTGLSRFAAGDRSDPSLRAQRPGPLARFLVLLLCVLLVQGAFVCQQAAAFSIKDELELGKKFNVLVRSRLPIIQDPEITEYIEGIVRRIAAVMPRQPFPFTPGVVNSSQVNAFATPGGYIFVYTGLILAMNNEAELAGVVTHELAHVTQRHIARRIETAQTVSLLSLIGVLAGAFLGGDAGMAAATGSLAASQAAMLNYSRADEAEADQVGMNYLINAKYDPRGMPGAFRVLNQRQWQLGSAIPPYLSSHPALTERIAQTEGRAMQLAGSKSGFLQNDAQFRRVQTILRARHTAPASASVHFNREKDGPNRCLALMGLGIVASRTNRINDATHAFDEALQCNRKDSLILREAGRFHYTKNNRTLGADLLREALSLNRRDIMARFYYARSMADQGQVEYAIGEMRELLRSVPEDSEVHSFLARYYGMTKDMFNANLHMAYSHMYVNNKAKVGQFHTAAKELAKTPGQEARLKTFEEILKERSQYW